MSKSLNITVDKLTVKELKKIIREEVKTAIQKYIPKQKDYYITEDGIKVLFEEDENITPELLSELKKIEKEPTISHEKLCKKLGIQAWK